MLTKFTLVRISIIILSLTLLWQAVVSGLQLPDYILPSPHAVFVTLILQRDIIAMHTLPTIIEIALGLSAGVLLGSFAGFITAYCKPLTPWFLPIMIASQAIPTFAIAPLIVIWLGFGLASKVAITSLMIFFPIASALFDGLRRTDPNLLSLATTMNATPWRLFCHIRLKAALPSFATGLRIAACVAPIGAIVGEWVGSSQGLGYLMLTANARMQIDMMFAVLLVIIMLALVLYASVDHLLKKLIWWQ